MPAPSLNRKKSRSFSRQKNGSAPSPVNNVSGGLLALMSNNKDRAVLKKMLMGAVVADASRAERVALKIASLAAEKESGPPYMPVDQELLAQAMVFSGINSKGVSYVPSEKINEVLSNLVPKAFGEGADTTFFNNDVLSSLVVHAANPEKSPLPAATKDALIPLLTTERRQAMVQMVSDGRLQPPISQQELLNVVAPDMAAPPVVNEMNEPSVANESAPADQVAPVERAQLGIDSIRPDSAELAAQAMLEADRYQLDLDMQTDALLQLNELMRRNPTWVNRSVREKLSDYLKDKRDGLIGRDVFTHPSESLFSETLAEVDETGRAKNEMVKFSNGPLNGFKATFKSPNAPKDAYLAACLRLRAEGVRYPYIKTTFRDKDAARQFLEMMVESLEESGYHIDDIRVSPNLEEMFRYLKETKYPAFTLEEAPQGVAETPDDPSVIQEQMPEELAIDRARRLSEEMLMKKYPELSAAEALQEELKMVNQVALKFADSRNDPERPLNLRDVEPKDMVEILSRRPLLAMSGDSWNSSVHSGGLVPTAQHVVKEVVREFERLIDLADPRVDSGKAELGPHQARLLLLAKDTLMHVMPERASQLSFVFGHIEGQKVESPLNAGHAHPDATAAAPDDYSPTEQESRPVQRDADWIDPAMLQPQPPLDAYAGDMQGEWEQPFDDWSPPQYDADPAPMEDASYYDAPPEDRYAGPYDDGVQFQQSAPGDVLQAQGAQPFATAPQGDFSLQDPQQIPYADEQPISQSEPDGGREVDDVETPVVSDPSMDAPDDFSLPPPDLSRARWDSVLGKELHEIPTEQLREIAEMTIHDAYHVQIMRTGDGWDVESMLEFKNVVGTVRQIVDPLNAASAAQTFSQREWDLLANLPSDIVPEGLQTLRQDYISRRQESHVAHSAQNELQHEPASVDISKFKNAIGCELHEIPVDLIRKMCTMSGDEAGQIRGAKDVEGWGPLQLDELRNAMETVRLLHAEPVVRESELSPRELALVRAMPDDLRPQLEVTEVPSNDVSRPANSPRP